MPSLILNVAEKPSVAKEAAIILSQNRYSSIRSDSQYNPIYEFDIQYQNQPAKMHFTSVTGHIMNFEFPPQYKEWRSVDPKSLLQGKSFFLKKTSRTIYKNTKTINKNTKI